MPATLSWCFNIAAARLLCGHGLLSASPPSKQSCLKPAKEDWWDSQPSCVVVLSTRATKPIASKNLEGGESLCYKQRRLLIVLRSRAKTNILKIWIFIHQCFVRFHTNNEYLCRQLIKAWENACGSQFKVQGHCNNWREHKIVSSGSSSLDLQARLDDATYTFEKKSRSLVWNFLCAWPSVLHSCVYIVLFKIFVEYLIINFVHFEDI